MTTTEHDPTTVKRTPIQAHVLNQLQEASAEIKSNARRVARLANEAVDAVDNAQTVNACGVLQATGRDLDQAALLRNHYATAARHAHCVPADVDLAARGTGTYFSAARS